MNRATIAAVGLTLVLAMIATVVVITALAILYSA